MNDASPLNIASRTAALMLAFTVVFTGFMAAVFKATEPEIAASAQESKRKLISEVLPPAQYDNVLLDDFIDLPAEPALGLTAPSRAYRARKAGQPVALVLEAAAPDGYSGHIGLLLAVRPDGSVIGVRVTEHKETPGLGDYIDPRKDKNKTSPWINQFSSPTAPREESRWRVKKDGGDFDYMTGATISARAVTAAVGRAARHVAAHRDPLFAVKPATTP